MNKRILVTSLLVILLGSAASFYRIEEKQAVPLADAKTLILYDAASGEIPSSSLMGFTAFPPDAASLLYVDGASVLDTTISGTDAYAGWVASQATTPGFPILDRTQGVQVSFSLQVESETHGNNHRAGFSVIILDQQAKGIEMSFWTNEIWVQHDDLTGSLFTHGEGAAFATTAWTDYQVTIVGDTYTLTANAQPILTGPVRDYSSFEGFPDPYQTPNFLFLGDDTTSSQARVKLRFLSVSGTEPAIPSAEVESSGTLTPAVSPTPLANAIPTFSPTSTPSDRGIELCLSSWIPGFVTLGSVMVSKRVRRGIRKCE